MSSLEQAFRSFERAATRLEERHSSLQDEVERLRGELLDANRRLETVLDAVDSGVAVIGADGAVLRTNAAFDRMGLGDGGGLHPALLALAAGDDRGHGNARVRLEADAGGAARDLAATRTPTGDAEGTRVLTVQDITAIRHEEAEGGRRQRLEALGRMAAELAHEVRNPLGSILLFAGMLRQDLADDGERAEMVEQIVAAGAGLEATVSNLLAFAAPPRSERRDVDVAALAREVCGLMKPACSLRGVVLRGPDSAERCVVTAEAEGLRQVLLNLLGNAVAATADDGRVDVAVRGAGDEAHIEVRDDGCGIAADDLQRVFDPFFSRTDHGTGLGLSIVHGVVERHGGRIAIDSRPGAGTRVAVSLPLAATTVAGGTRA